MPKFSVMKNFVVLLIENIVESKESSAVFEWDALNLLRVHSMYGLRIRF